MRVLALALAAVLALSCRPAATRAPGFPATEDSMSLPRIADVLARHTADLLAIPGVIGTGEGRRAGRPLFVVFVVRRTEEIERRVPRTIEGYAVELRVSGEVTAPPGPRPDRPTKPR